MGEKSNDIMKEYLLSVKLNCYENMFKLKDRGETGNLGDLVQVHVTAMPPKVEQEISQVE